MAPTPPLIVLAGRVFGSDGSEAVAVSQERIEAVGTRRKMLALRGPDTRVVEVPGGLICPGFHDAHAHLLHAATARLELDLHGLDGAGTADAVRRAAGDRAPGRWVIGSGYDPDVLESLGVTPRALLDEAAPDHPVYLRAHDHHSAALNSQALRLTGFLPDPPEVPGGEVVRAGDGCPAGVLREAAAWVAEAQAGDLSDEERGAAVRAVFAELHRAGLTALHDMSGSRGLSLLRALDAEGDLGLDVFATLAPEDVGSEGAADPGDRLKIIGMKAFLDGALGSRTALLLEPYEGDPAHAGIATLPPDTAHEQVAAAARAGLPSFLHAIGDGAVRLALDALCAVPEAPDGRRLRHRVEHAQMIHDADLPRFREAGIVASAQPVHMALDAPLVLRHWGDRSREAFPLRRLIDSGAVVAFGSDGPIETFDVIEGIRAAVSRTGRDGTVLHAEEAVTIPEAIRAYTEGAAWAAGEEQRGGRIAPGFVGSLTVLSHDIVEDAAALADCRVAATVVRGDATFEVAAG